MTLPELLEIAQEDPELIEKLIIAINSGFWEEWDCDLLTGVTVHGFGPPEIGIAAKAAPREVNPMSAAERDGSGLNTEGDVHKIVVKFTSKNSGPHKDTTRSDQRTILVNLVEELLQGVHREQLPWIVEVEVG